MSATQGSPRWAGRCAMHHGAIGVVLRSLSVATLCVLLPHPCHAASRSDALSESVRYKRLKPGARVELGTHDSRNNWRSEMDKYVGVATEVTEGVGEDPWGHYCVRVKADGGLFNWRVANLREILGRFLTAEFLPGTEIATCVVPIHSEIQVFSASDSASDLRCVIPAYRRVDGDGRSWCIPSCLFVHAAQSEFLEVMESDFLSSSTLGWVRNEDVLRWDTREGYTIDRMRIGREATPVLGYVSLDAVGDPAGVCFREDLSASRIWDPNVNGMPEGLLLEKHFVRGNVVIKCAMLEKDGSRKVAFIPFNPRRPSLVPYVLLTDVNLTEFLMAMNMLISACERRDFNEIREALAVGWDEEARLLAGGATAGQVQFRRFADKVPQLYPALAPLMELPPGEADRGTFETMKKRAEHCLATAARTLAAMAAGRRNWAWLEVSALY